MERGQWARAVFVPVADDPKAVYSALRWPLAAALFATALVLWRIGMDGVTSAGLLAHAGWCLGLGAEAPQAQIASVFGHCAACYAGVAAATAAAVTALWPRS